MQAALTIPFATSSVILAHKVVIGRMMHYIPLTPLFVPETVLKL